jgi:hypothetical protein
LGIFAHNAHELAREMYAQQDANLNAIARAAALARPGAGGNGKEPPDDPCDKAGKRGKSGETAATAAGRAAHKRWQPPPGFQKEFRLPSGGRADAVNPTTREVIELKPNNPRAIRGGQRQVQRYVDELSEMTGQPWSGRVETYNP